MWLLNYIIYYSKLTASAKSSCQTSSLLLLTARVDDWRLCVTMATVAGQRSPCRCQTDFPSRSWRHNIRFVWGCSRIIVINRTKTLTVKCSTDKVRSGVLVVCSRTVARMLNDLQTNQQTNVTEITYKANKASLCYRACQVPFFLFLCLPDCFTVHICFFGVV